MNKALVITGGSKGIGRAACELFLQQGYRVINLSRSACPVAEVRQIHVDMGELCWLDSAKDELTGALEGIEQICLIHNAAVLEKDSSRDIEGASFSRVMQLNVIAPAQLNALLIPIMGAGSSVLYVGSTLSEVAVPNSCSYVSSKHALLGLMRANCQDLMGSGIHTACICPGFTDTEMLRDHLGNDEAILADLATNNAYGRLIDPIEIARSLWFCASEPVINGTVIHANLGQKQS